MTEPVKEEIKQELVTKQYYELDQSRVNNISHELDHKDRSELYTYGSDLQNELSEISNQILDESRDFDPKVIQKNLDDLLKRFDDADPDKLLPEERNAVSQWWSKITKSFEKQLGLLETTSSKIDKIAEELKGNQKDILQDAGRLEQMNEISKRLDEELQYYIEGANLKVEQLKNETLPQLQENVQNDDLRAAQDIQDTKDFIEAIEKRRYDLELTQAVILQSRVELRAMSGLNHALAEKIDQSIVVNIPIWRMSFAKAINIAKQRSTMNAIIKIDEGTNELLVKNSEHAAKSIVDGAKQMSTPSVNMETLRKGRNDIMKAIKESQQINEDNKRKQEQRRQEFESYRRETLEILDQTSEALKEG